MLSPDQAQRVLREIIAAHAVKARYLVVEDRTGLLKPAVGQGLLLKVAGQEWLVLPAGPVLQMRRCLWEAKAERVALVVPRGETPAGVRDLTSHAPHIAARGADFLRVLADITLPDDARLDPLAETLLDHPDRLGRLRGQRFPSARLPQAVVSALLGEDLLDTPSDAVALARVLRSEATVPQIAHSLCQEYAETLSMPFRRLVAGLLTFPHSRAEVGRTLLQAEIRRREGKVTSDPLVQEFLVHAAGTDDVAILEAFAQRVEEALLAEPDWGREFVRRHLPPQGVHVPTRILPTSLEDEMRRQLRELVSGQRSAVDDRWWREHLFYEQYRPWGAILNRVALLSQVQGEVKGLLSQDAGLPRLVQAYAERISAGDLAWMELGTLSTQAIPLQAEIGEVRNAYQQARTDLNRAFAEGYAKEYPRLFGTADLPLVVHLVQREIKPRLSAGEQVLVVLVDGLGYPLWLRFRSDLAALGWQVEDGFSLALLPTVTAVSRYAIFSGPVARWVYPDLSAEPDDELPSEDERKALETALSGRAIAVYKKPDLKAGLGAVAEAIRGRQHDVIVVVINEVDEAIRAAAGAPFPLRLDGYPLLSAVLEAARGSERTVLLVADHGFTPDGGCKWPVPAGLEVVESRLARGPRTDQGKALPALWCEDLVYDLGGPYLALYDFGGRFKQQPKVGYHSGIGLEEVVVPTAWLNVGKAAPALTLRFVDLPHEVTEDEEVAVTVELATQAGAPGEGRVEVRMPGLPPVLFRAEPEPGLPFQRWQVCWRPTLPPREPVEPETVVLRAVCYHGDREVSRVEAEVTIRPRPGKYESAAATLLP